MQTQQIDYDALKKRGFLRQKQEGYFLLRTRTDAGNFSAAQLAALVNIAGNFGRDIIHPSMRQGLEIPFIRYEDIDQVEKEVLNAGVLPGTSGPRLRATTTCPGNNWCRQGLVDTFGFFKRIEDELGLRCAYDLPQKFKIAISGCPNRCTRGESSEIGIHGAIDTKDPDKRRGWTIYLGGCGGRNPRFGIKLDRVFTEDEVLGVIERTVNFYKTHAKPRQRLARLIDEVGEEAFLKEIQASV